MWNPVTLGFLAKNGDCLRHNPESRNSFTLNVRSGVKTSGKTPVATAVKTTPMRYRTLEAVHHEDRSSSDLLSHNQNGQAPAMTPQSFPRRSQALPRALPIPVARRGLQHLHKVDMHHSSRLSLSLLRLDTTPSTRTGDDCPATAPFDPKANFYLTPTPTHQRFKHSS